MKTISENNTCHSSAIPTSNLRHQPHTEFLQLDVSIE